MTKIYFFYFFVIFNIIINVGIEVCDDGFVFTVDNPWNAKVTEKGVTLLTNNAKKIIKQINEDSDYILLIMKQVMLITKYI